MAHSPYQPAYEFTRGDIVESIHFAAIAVVDVYGNLLAYHGDPNTVTFLRSTAKPMQALAFVEAGGPKALNLSEKELALICASHSGTDDHALTATSIQQKANITETDLQCGVHLPMHKDTANALRDRGETLTSNRHNCSGKHSGMLAFAKWKGWPLETYLECENPLQQLILQTVSELTDVPVADIHMGTDGCSAPNFAFPLSNTALALARFADPSQLSPTRAAACRQITHAMMSHPNMVGGPDRFDTTLMQAFGGNLFCKGGAQGYQGIGLMPGLLHAENPFGYATGESPAIGIALKVSDGNARGSAVEAVALETLRQIGALDSAHAAAMQAFGPHLTVHNWRKLEVGEGRPSFTLKRP